MRTFKYIFHHLVCYCFPRDDGKFTRERKHKRPHRLWRIRSLVDLYRQKRCQVPLLFKSEATVINLATWSELSLRWKAQISLFLLMMKAGGCWLSCWCLSIRWKVLILISTVSGFGQSNVAKLSASYVEKADLMTTFADSLDSIISKYFFHQKQFSWKRFDEVFKQKCLPISFKNRSERKHLIFPHGWTLNHRRRRISFIPAVKWEFRPANRSSTVLIEDILNDERLFDRQLVAWWGKLSKFMSFSKSDLIFNKFTILLLFHSPSADVSYKPGAI